MHQVAQICAISTLILTLAHSLAHRFFKLHNILILALAHFTSTSILQVAQICANSTLILAPGRGNFYLLRGSITFT